MIHEEHGNLLAADADALVNTVNTVGIAGKGIALQFRQAYPDNFRAYEKAAKRGEVVPGRMFVWETGQLERPHLIINFPTKRHWRGRSRIEDIRAGLQDLIRCIEQYEISSIAVPPLGCGNGGLNWGEVRKLIVDALEPLEVRVLLYAPEGAPPADEMPVRSKKRPMTRGRAALLLLMKFYRDSEWLRLSALEVQKMAYFLQESGEPLSLIYEKARYGPYAENLNHVLQNMEGHYTRGYGDRTIAPQIHVLDGAYDAATEFLRNYPETSERLQRVADLLEDWETPYGLELLATVHWAMNKVEPSLQTRDEICSFVANWTPRKAKLFKPSQVNRTINHLIRYGFASPLPDREPCGTAPGVNLQSLAIRHRKAVTEQDSPTDLVWRTSPLIPAAPHRHSGSVSELSHSKPATCSATPLRMLSSTC